MSGSASVPPLPAGYTLDQSAAPPPLPPGYTLDGQGERGYAPAPPEPPAETSLLADAAGRMVRGTMPGLAIQGARAVYDAVTAPPPGPPPAKTPWTEDNPAFAAGDPREALPPSTVDWGKVGGAVREGWNGPVSLLPPGSDDAGQERLYGPYVGGAINTLFRFPLGLPSALTYGAAEFAHQVTGDPRAAREVMRAAEMLPMHGSLGGPRPISEPAVAPRVAPLMDSFNRMDAARAAETPRPDTVWPLRFNDEPPPGSSQAPGAAPPAEPPPVPPAVPGAAPAPEPPPIPPKQSEPPPVQPAAATEPPGPRSVGAAASRDITPAAELGLTPGEEAAYRTTAEGNKLLEPQEPGIRDDKQYLTGERINEAQASQDVEVARELQSLRQQTPALDKSMTTDEAHNNNIRSNAINNALPGQVQITAAKSARTDAMKVAEPIVFANSTDAAVQPIVEGIQKILNDPKNRQNSQLQQYVRPLIDRLQNADGTPKITDPLELWGFRQDVQHLTSGAAQRGDPNLSRVSGMLGNVLDATDNQIEAAAPGYKANLRDDYRNRSREIDAMEALNAERFKLFDTQNKPNYNAVQGLMRRIVDARQANDPYEPFTHVPQETLDKLWNIRDSMRRQAAVDRLGAPRGSPTSQNLGDALRGAGKMALQGAAPVIGGTLGAALIPIPGVGPAIGLAAGATVNHLLSERAMGQRLARGLELTNPNKMQRALRGAFADISR